MNDQDLNKEVQVDMKHLSMSDLYTDYQKILEERKQEYSVKRDRFKLLYYLLNVSHVILQSSGILSIGSTFYSDSLGAKVVAFASNGLALTLVGLDKLLNTNIMYKGYSKKFKDFEHLQLQLVEKKLKGEDFSDIEKQLEELDKISVGDN